MSNTESQHPYSKIQCLTTGSDSLTHREEVAEDGEFKIHAASQIGCVSFPAKEESYGKGTN